MRCCYSWLGIWKERRKERRENAEDERTEGYWELLGAEKDSVSSVNLDHTPGHSRQPSRGATTARSFRLLSVLGEDQREGEGEEDDSNVSNQTPVKTDHSINSLA